MSCPQPKLRKAIGVDCVERAQDFVRAFTSAPNGSDIEFSLARLGDHGKLLNPQPPARRGDTITFCPGDLFVGLPRVNATLENTKPLQ